MTTATPMTREQRANYVQRRVELALLPGGPLYLELEELITQAECEALDALGVAPADHLEATESGDWSVDHDAIASEVARVIAETMFEAAKALRAGAGAMTPDDWSRYGLTPELGRQMLATRETIAQATAAALRVHPDRSRAQLQADAHRLARALEPSPTDGTIPLPPHEQRAMLALRFRVRHGL